MAWIKFDNVTLDYPVRGRPRRLLPSAAAGKVGSALLETSGGMVVRALNNLSFELSKGDRLALIGRNGAGKSTLLMALAGIYKPASGNIETRGKIEAMFNIRLGFREEATGRRNIVLRGLMRGLHPKQIEEAIPEIIEFSELGDFIDLPLGTYSSGMAARLAFATATAFRPDILLLDEWIGAGDARFQARARERMDAFVADAGIVVLASHSQSILRQVCNKALLLDGGEVRYFGEVDEALKLHLEG
jgi:lipopolysaccharide transport system ATP-binding protein